MHELRDPRGQRGLDQVDALGEFALEVPGVAAQLRHLHGEDGAGAPGGRDQRCGVAEIAGDQLGAEGGDGGGLGGSRVTDQGAHRDAGGEQGAGGCPALLAGSAGDQYWCSI